jgi:hypothetical protein
MYARQARNVDAERDACEIRLRAARRWGELYRKSEKAKAGRPPLNPSQATTDLPPTLESMGVTRDQSSRWQGLADVRQADFRGGARRKLGEFNAQAINNDAAKKLAPGAGDGW